MRSQFSTCDECDARCCKIWPPYLFKFERKLFKDHIYFSRYKGQKVQSLEKHRKECVFLKNNKCSIYEKRPVDCIMFPFDIRKIKGEFFWIVWEFCKTPENIENHLSEFEKTIIPKLEKDDLEFYSDETQHECFKNIKMRVLRKIKHHF